MRLDFQGWPGVRLHAGVARGKSLPPLHNPVPSTVSRAHSWSGPLLRHSTHGSNYSPAKNISTLPTDHPQAVSNDPLNSRHVGPTRLDVGS
jgi:hypothetical protein